MIVHTWRSAIAVGQVEIARSYQAVCGCGWQGPVRATELEAENDRRAHDNGRPGDLHRVRFLDLRR